MGVLIACRLLLRITQARALAACLTVVLLVLLRSTSVGGLRIWNLECAGGWSGMEPDSLHVWALAMGVSPACSKSALVTAFEGRANGCRVGTEQDPFADQIDVV